MNKMKTTLLITLAAGIGLTAFHDPEGIINIGEAAPQADLKMLDVSGEEYSLNDLKDANGLLVVFSCNTCPFVVGNGEKSDGWEGRYNDVYDLVSGSNLGMVLVNSNEAKRDGNDSFEKMQAHSEDAGYKMKYVVDEDHVLADAFGAKTTPHVLLFDSNMKLVYKGAIDDNVNRADEVEQQYLSDAVKNLVAGKTIDPNSTKQLGCSIKRVKS